MMLLMLLLQLRIRDFVSHMSSVSVLSVGKFGTIDFGNGNRKLSVNSIQLTVRCTICGTSGKGSTGGEYFVHVVRVGSMRLLSCGGHPYPQPHQFLRRLSLLKARSNRAREKRREDLPAAQFGSIKPCDRPFQ